MHSTAKGMISYAIIPYHTPKTADLPHSGDFLPYHTLPYP